MSLHQSSQLTSALIPAQSNVGSIPLHCGVNSLVVDSKLSKNLYDKLAKQFQLTRYTTDMNMNGFDAIFVDCRGAQIQCPFESVSERPNITVALIDENSYLPSDTIPTLTNRQLSSLELTTEAELGSSVLKLRLDTRTRQYGKPANADCSDTSLTNDNTYDILQAFLRYSTDWIVFKDLNHRFMMATDRFLEAQNKKAQDVIGKNDLEIGTSRELVLGNPDKNWKGYWKLDEEVIASGKPSFTEHWVIQENALEQVRERVAKVPVLNSAGNAIGLLVCVTQVNSSKFNGRKVTQISSRCSSKIASVVEKFEDIRSKPLSSEISTSVGFTTPFKRKNNFIATASHDLRQPLQAIGLFIESLEHQIVDKGQRSTLKKMKQSSNDLTELLNSILDISKLDAGAVLAAKTHFCIAPLLKTLEDEFATEARRKSLNLNVSSANSFVFTDSLLLARILRNLVNNAVKYTNSGNVNLITEAKGDSLLIHIEDSGPGIPKEQYLDIFDEYNDLEDQSSQPNFGMGMGLSIVKRLTDLLELEISLESKMSYGTQVTVTVPLGVETSNWVDEKKEVKLKPSEPYKILIVEDNPTVLDAMQLMLTSMNCDAYPASDIPEALEIIKELDELPDLLVVDFQLADGVSGNIAIEKICKAAGEKLPAIIITGNTNSSVFRQASNSAFRVLNKPVNPDGLLKTIDSAVKAHRKAQVLA